MVRVFFIALLGVFFVRSVSGQDVIREVYVMSHKDSVELLSPIPISYITPQSTKLLADLANVEKKIEKLDNLDVLNADWQELDENINEYLVVFQQLEFEQQGIIILYNHQRELQFWNDEVKEFLSGVLNRKDDLNKKFLNFSRLSEKWKATLNYAEKNAVDHVITNQVKNVLRELHLTQKAIRKAQAHFVSIDAQISEKILDLEFQIASIEKYRAAPHYSDTTTTGELVWDVEHYYQRSIQFYRDDWHYLGWVLSTVQWQEILWLLVILFGAHLAIKRAQHNIRFYDYWAEKLKTKGAIRFIFEHKIWFIILVVQFSLSSAFPGISYIWLFARIGMILIVLSKTFEGLGFPKVPYLWRCCLGLLFVNICVLPVDLSIGWNILGIVLCDLIIAYVVIQYALLYKRKDRRKVSRAILTLLIAPFLSLCGIALGQESIIFLPMDVVQASILFAVSFTVLFRLSVIILPIALFGGVAFELQTVFKNKDKIVGTIYFWSKYAYVYLLLSSLLDMLAQREFFFGRILELVNYNIELGAIAFSISSIFVFSITLYVVSIIGKIVTTLLKEDFFRTFAISSDAGSALVLISRYVFFILGFFVSLAAAGIDLGNLAVILGAIGVGLGFGLQSLVANFISGLVLVAERPFKLGDILELEDKTIGEVKEIGVRSSIIRLFDGAEVIVPNSNLISDKLTNWTFSGQTRRVQVNVGVSYDSDPVKVRKVLTSLVKRADYILSEPKPLVLMDEFADSSLNFRLLIWTNQSWNITKSEIMIAIVKAFRTHHIEIPFPQRDLHVIDLTDKEEPKKQ